MTTGGYTDSTLSLGEIFNWVNATCTADQDNDLKNCTISIIDPYVILKVNNVSMTLVSGDVYSYSTDYEPDSAGTWTINITSFDGSSHASTTTTFSVVTQNQSTKDGWYGYTEGNLTTNSTFDTLVTYGYDLVEITINDTRLLTDWNTTIGIIDYAHDKNIKIGLNLLITIDATDGTAIESVKQNISDTYNKITTVPYLQTVEYLSLELNTVLGNANDINILNNISERITVNTSNDFIIYSKTINSTNLDSAYIDYTDMIYLISPNLLTWIELEKAWARNRTTLNRIYETTNDTVRTSIQNYQEDIFDNLRGTLTGAPHSQAEVVVLSNNDTIIFNNDTAHQTITINVSDLGIVGEDVYDLYMGYVIESNTTGDAIPVNVTGSFATLLFFDDLDHIEMTSSVLGTLYKESSTGELRYNYTERPGVTPILANWEIHGANDIMTELFDPTYVLNEFITYYGWMNASHINFTTRGCDYEALILGDLNSQELNRLNFSCGTEYYMYINVADYDNTEAWQATKEAEVDAILDINESLHIFIDGLDTGVGGTNFSVRFKELADYTRITKGRKVIANTYTAYTDFCGMVDGCMKESCVNRWNGTGGVPDYYDREDWDLELAKSTWYDSHGVEIYCQAFDNRTADTNKILNYSETRNIFYASKVLGYDYFYLSQQDFNYDHLEYLPDVGADLSTGYLTDNNETYYRRYENGIVYYNSSSEQGWFDDGRTINTINVTLELKDYGYSGKTVECNVNKRGGASENGEYIIANSNDYPDGVWLNISKTINTTEGEGGRYTFECWNMDRSTTPSQGWAIRNSVVPDLGLRESWWDDSANDVWNLYDPNKNWNIYLTINSTTKVAIDHTSTIWQNSTRTTTQTAVNISSDKHQDIEVWSDPVVTSSGTFINFTYYNATEWIAIGTINTTTCDSSNPIFNYTSINETKSVGSCYKNINASSLWIRFSAPELSTQQFAMNGNNPPTTPTIINPANNSLFSSYPIVLNYSSSDIDGDPITYSVYIDGTLNGTTAVNWSFNASDGTYLWNVMASDGTDNSANSSIYTFTLDSIPPFFSLNNTNDTTPKIYEGVQINITINDTTTNVSGFIFSWDNGTGTFVNDSYRPLGDDAQSEIVVVNKTIERVQGTLMTWRWHANDTLGNWNVSTNESLTVANTVPTTPTIIHPANNSILNSYPILLNYSSSDADSHSITYWIYINNILNGSTAVNWSFNASDSTYTWYVIAGDGIDNSSNSSINSFILDSTPPFFTLNTTNNSAPRIKKSVQFNLTINDTTTNVSGYIFAWDNGTGTFVNDSYRPLGDDAQSEIVSVNKTIERRGGITMSWKWYANDSAGNWNVSSTYNLSVRGSAGEVISAGPTGGGSGSLADKCETQGLILGADGYCHEPEARESILESVGIKSIWDKIFPDYTLNVKNDGVCQIGEDPIFYNKEDCSFPIISFMKDEHFKEGWVTRLLFIITLLLMIWPNVKGLWKKEYY